MSRPEGFTSRRRRYLAKKVDRLDRLENRTTLTEPISVVGLLMGSLRWLDQLGIVDKRMLGNPVSRLAPTGQVSTQGQAQAQKAPAAPDSSDSIMASRQRDHSGQAGGGGGSSGPGDATAATNASAAQQSYDWLAFNTSSESGSTGTGFSTPWQPAKGPGGGAALPPRGGSVGGPRGSRPAVRGAIAPLTLPLSVPSAHIGGNSAAPPYVPPNAGAGAATKRPREVSRARLPLQPAVLVRARRQDQRQPHPLPASAFRPAVPRPAARRQRRPARRLFPKIPRRSHTRPRSISTDRSCHQARPRFPSTRWTISRAPSSSPTPCS